MKRTKTLPWIAAALLGAATLALVGCGDSAPENGKTVFKANNNDEQIKHIQDNPNMPDNLKQQAIAALKRGADNGKAVDAAHPDKTH